MQIANWWVIEYRAPGRGYWHVITQQHLRAVGSRVQVGDIRAYMDPKTLPFCLKWFVKLAHWSENEGRGIPYQKAYLIKDLSGLSLRIRNLHSDEVIPMEAFAMSPALLT